MTTSGGVHAAKLVSGEGAARDDDRVVMFAQRRASGGEDPATSSPGVLRAWVQLHMAIGSEHEDLGRHALAFRHYVEAKRRVAPVDPDSSARTRRIVDAFMRDFRIAHVADVGYESFEPIFVLGLPHTGVDTAARWLGAHPAVHALDDDQRFARAFQATSHGMTPAVFDLDGPNAARDRWWRELGERYVLETRPATGATPFFVDAWPHNYLYLGLIARALPHARIIALHRHPLDACVASLCTLDPPDSEFSDQGLSLDAAGQHFVQHARLMAHWRSVLPGRIHDIAYEDMVTDPRGTASRLYACAGLPDKAGVAALGGATAAVGPIDVPANTVVGRWRRFTAEIAPLRTLLESHGIPCGD